MPSLKMSMDLRNRSKVNWVQNNTKLDKRSVSMSYSNLMIPINFTDTFQDEPHIHVAFNNLDKKRTFAHARSFRCTFCKIK